MDRDFAKELVEVLQRWQNARVAVRVVAGDGELVAVFSGTLGSRSRETTPSLFWPVDLDAAATPRFEKPGIYAHAELLSDVREHIGGFVVEFTQAGMTVNLRRLDARKP